MRLAGPGSPRSGTYLAWWRTGLTAIAVGIATGGIAPKLVGEARWAYVGLGCGFALLGVAVLVYGFRRHIAVDRAHSSAASSRLPTSASSSRSPRRRRARRADRHPSTLLALMSDLAPTTRRSRPPPADHLPRGADRARAGAPARRRARRALGAGRDARARRAGLELADEVIAFDDEVDSALPRDPGGIESLLARQTPVASDLRLVLAMLHVNLHLERMADYCVTVAKLTKLAGARRPRRGSPRPSPRWACAQRR